MRAQRMYAGGIYARIAYIESCDYVIDWGKVACHYLHAAGPSGALRQPVHFWTGFPGDLFRSCLVWHASII